MIFISHASADDKFVAELRKALESHKATATLVYEPADPGARRIESRRFTFTAPLGPIETADLRWYLETYYIWPDKMAQERAEGIANKLPRWGQEQLAIIQMPGNHLSSPSHEMGRALGVTQKTAWFMLHRIRGATGLQGRRQSALPWDPRRASGRRGGRLALLARSPVEVAKTTRMLP